MKTAYLFRTGVLVGFIIIAASCRVLAEAMPDSEVVEPLALRKIMYNLGKNMQSITDGISREDWKLVENAALQVAEHPKPPLVEKMRILNFVGTDIRLFKEHDSKTHNAAMVLGSAAAEQNGYKVISAFSTLQNSCLTCHQYFRQPFQEHFYQQQ